MGLLYPELLILMLPALWVWWRFRDSHPVTQGVRLLVIVALGLALAAPYLRTSTRGRDLVFVVDRSRSMPPESIAAALEMIQMAEAERRENDRVAVVSFGEQAVLEQLPSESARFAGFDQHLDADGSDVGRALETALNLIPKGRAGSIVLISDGENNGEDAVATARRAYGRDVRIDVRSFPRPETADLSVERIELPEQVGAGEPFQFTVWVRADREADAEFRLERGGRVLSSGHRVFEKGLNRLVFRDVLERAGTVDYQVELGGDRDRIPENNKGLGAVLVEGARAVLVLNDDGAEDTLSQALRAAQIAVEVRAPEAARLDDVGLTAYRAVILENVAAPRLGPGLVSLRDFVLERGGGLLITGGQSSFGVGGYFRSVLDPVLPVSMEMRQEHRKQAIALAISMDRSGSMSMPVNANQTKMDLANLGAAAAIELLSPMDSVAVIAVDSAPHVVQDLVRVEDRGAVLSRVRRIQSMGGGIFTYTALVAAGLELEKATQQNRHIILFADAADSEEQEKCPELLRDLGQMGVTVSVIALGTPADPDADFLRMVAKVGGGEIYFTTDAGALPRLFAMDTIKAARATFVEEPAAVRTLADLFAMGEVPASPFPVLPGYNLTYLRPGALTGAVTEDDYRAPIYAFHYQGLGRAAAFTGQIGGSFGAPVAAWDGFATFFVTVTRWLIGQEAPEEFFPSVHRDGKDAVVRVDVDPDRGPPPDTSVLEARILQGQDGITSLPLERVSATRFEARYPLRQEGIALGTVRLGDDRFVHLPPITLPYSPEFERSLDPGRGVRLLRQVAQESGGMQEPAVSDLLRGDREGRATRLVSRELILAALVLMLIEIAGRRLQLWSGWRWPSRIVRRLGALRMPRRRRPLARAEGAGRPTGDTIPVAAASTTRPSPDPSRAPPPADPSPAGKPAPPDPAPAPSLGSALERARRKADRRLDRP